MIAAILKKPGNIEIQEIEKPVPAKGELLVRVNAALTCGTDLKAYLRGHKLIPMPGVFGHEFSGIVAEQGKGVKGFKCGDAIMGVHSAPCLKCPYCRKKLFNLCENIMSSKVLGAFAEYILVPAHIVSQNIFKKPDDLSFAEAAFLEPLACVVHGMEGVRTKKDDTILIIGAGPIGLLHLIIAKLKGSRVFVTGLEEDRLETAKNLGADRVFHPEKIAEIISDCTSVNGVDYVIECTGQPSVWESSIKYVRRGGTVVLFGGCKTGTVVKYLAERLHYDEITLRGTFHFTPADVRKAYQLLISGEVNVSRLITDTFKLKDIQVAFERLAKGKGIKYAVIP